MKWLSFFGFLWFVIGEYALIQGKEDAADLAFVCSTIFLVGFLVVKETKEMLRE